MQATRSGSPTLDEHAQAALERIVFELIERHERLLDELGAQRVALAAADPARLKEAGDRCADLLESIGVLEDERRSLLGEVPSGPRTSITQLAPSLSVERRERVIDLGARLRSLIERCMREQSSLRAAAESLSGHMEGLIRQVVSRLSHTGAYDQSGRVEQGAAVVSALDVKQ
jgi:hypothetical protein